MNRPTVMRFATVAGAMPHVSQALLPESGESRTAIGKTVKFFKENLQ